MMSHFFSFQGFLCFFVFQHSDYAEFGYGPLCLSRIGMNYLNWNLLSVWICRLMFLLIKFGKSSSVIFFSFLFLLFWFSQCTLVGIFMVYHISWKSCACSLIIPSLCSLHCMISIDLYSYSLILLHAQIYFCAPK